MNRSLIILAMTNLLALTNASFAERADAGASALATLKQSNDKLTRFILDNGMTCLVKPDAAAPVVSIQIWVGSGSIHEGDLMGAGLSHYVEHMLFKGTPTRKPGEITKALHALGGDVNAYTSLDRTVFHTDLPSRYWKEGLTILADAVMNASFPAEEWGKEKDVILRELSMGRDNPDRQINELLWRTAYTLHPYRVPVIGYRDVFKAVTRDDLLAYFHRRYVPDNMLAVIVGDIQPKEVEQALREVFAAFTRRANPPVTIPEEPRQTAPRVARETGPHQVSRLHLAFHTVSLADKDAPALELLAAITGGGQSSRLVQSIKENQALVHSISASSFTPRYPGLFVIGAMFDPAKESAVIEAIDREAASWSKTLFPAAEIEKARRMLLVGELSTLQSMNGQAAAYASGELFMQNPRFGESYLEQLGRVTPTDIRAVAAKYLQADNRSLVVLAPDKQAPRTEVAAETNRNSEVTSRKLPDGATLILREDHRLPFVYLCTAFQGGVISEQETNAGITSLMSDLMIRGTPSHTATEIARTVETLGADLSPFSGHNSFGLQARCLAGDAETLVDILADCLGNATFPTDEIAKQKTVQLASIDAQREQPFFVAQSALDALLFAGHPYRWNPLGRRAAVETLDQPALVDYYRRQVVAGNMAVSIFGDITPAAAEKLAARLTRRLPKIAAPARVTVKATPTLPARVENKEPKEQCIIILGFPGIALHDPRKDALQVLEAAMSGMSSRIFHSIREERGLAYFAGANQRIGVDPGLFILYAGTRAEARAEVESLLLAEIARIGLEGLDQDEINRAKNQLIADQEMRLQDGMTLAVACSLNELYGLGCGYDFTTRQRIEAVTPDQIRNAAATILSTNRMAVSVVIPQKKEK
jgi:zinc protease